MRAQHQRFFHKPEEDIWGDCHRTAIAMLLDMERDAIPHFGFRCNDSEEFDRNVTDWLNTQGFTQITVAYLAGNEDSLTDILHSINVQNGPGLVFLLGGRSPRGEYNHTVIAGDGRILLDPHPDNTGLAGPSVQSLMYFVTFIVKKDHVRRASLGTLQLALPLVELSSGQDTRSVVCQPTL